MVTAENFLGRPCSYAALIFLALVFQAGCYIPVRYSPSGVTPMRPEISRQVTSPIVAGTATLKEVLFQIGEPDYWSQEQHILVYEWNVVVGILFLMHRGEEIEKMHCMAVYLDENHIVTGIKRYSRWSFEEHQLLINSLLAGQAIPENDLPPPPRPITTPKPFTND
jgi:hypothetical protein